MFREVSFNPNNKGRTNLTLPSPPLINMDLLLKQLLPPISCQANQAKTKKEHGGGFGRRNWLIGIGIIINISSSSWWINW